MVVRRRQAHTLGAEGAEGRVARKHRPDYRIVLFMGLLVLVGLVVLFAISPYQIHRINNDGGSIDQSHFMLKQLLYLGIGLSTFAMSALVPMDVWKRFANKLVLAALGLCLVLALLGAMNTAPAMCFNGACRWFDLGFTSFQPAEFLKFGLLIFTAVFLAQRMKKGSVSDLNDTLIPLGVVVAVATVFVVGLQKDMGTGITMIGIVVTMLIVAGLNIRMLLFAGLTGLAIAAMFIITSPHRLERIMTFANAETVTDASSYHIEMAKIAIGSGGFFGRGLAGGVQAFGYLPEALNDSIFAVLGEIFGFGGLLVIMGLFAALLRRVIGMADMLDDPMMKLLAAGVFGWLGTHVVINIGSMTGIFPLTGVTLPFLSFGGTSLLFMMAALGIVYHISRYTTHNLASERSADETSRSGRRLRRTRHTSSGRY